MALPIRTSSRSASSNRSPVVGNGMQAFQSPLVGLPPLLVPPSSAASSSTGTSASSHFPISPAAPSYTAGVLPPGAEPPVSPEHYRYLRGNDASGNGNGGFVGGIKTYDSPVPGLPPLMMPVNSSSRHLRPPVTPEKNVGGVNPLIPVLPPSPSLDMAFFSGGTTLHNNNNNNNINNGTSLERSYSNSQSSLTSGKTSTESSHTLVSVSSYSAAHSIGMKQRKTPSPGPGSGQRGGGGRTPPAYPPPQESLPLPPTSGAGGGAGSAIVRSPSPLSEEIQPYHSSSSSSTSAAAAVQLQGLGLGPVHRSVAEGQHSLRSVSTPTPALQHRGVPNPSTGRARQQPEVHVIASSFQTRDGDVYGGGGGGPVRPIHRDLPPIITTPAVPNHQDRVVGSQQQQLPPRSVSLSNPHRGQQVSGTSSSASGGASGRKLPAPPALEIKALNNNHQRQFHSPQLLSPGMGMGMVSPGFSPTNVVVDSLIEEMHDEEEHGKDRPTAGGEGDDGTPVRKTSILNRPRPRASSRSSSYRADPLSRTPTPQQTTFSPGIHDPNLFANMQQHQQQDGQQNSATNPYYRPSIQLTDVIIHEGVQKALLPCLSIASFLALLSAFDKRWRRCISGEMVGKWIVKEWSLNLGPDVVWPGLGVWEGFLESLLHNPEAYPTYPAHLTSLLRHLSLSHTLIVLFLRSLPPTAFPTMPPFPFEDEPTNTSLSHSISNLSLFGNGQRSRTTSSGPGSEHGGSVGGGGGGGGPSRMPRIPKAERVVELVMPEPLSAIKSDLGSQELLSSPTFANGMTSRQHKRRSSVGAASFVSWTKERRGSESSAAGSAFVVPRREGKKQSAPPPVSFPTAKRYVFKGFGDPTFTHSRKRNSLDGGGPGSIFSVDESAAGRSLYGESSGGSTFPSRNGQMRSTRPFGEFVTGKQSMGGNSSPSTNSLARFAGSMSEDRTATSSPTFGRLRASTPQPVEPAFQKPIPYTVGRVPILRVFVPLSEQVPDWPCAEGARRARHELERCGAWSKLRLGDIIINTALRDSLSSRHLMLFVPTVQPYLVPLEYKFSPDGHLPGYFDAFQVPPSYYYPLLPAPHIVSPDLSPWADSAVATIRLAFERSDITTSRGEKIVAKRYLHVCGFEISSNASHLACEEWQGMVTLEAEGTAEGRASLLRRLGRAANESRIHAQRGPWEIIPEKSLGGTVWLRLIPERVTAASPI